MKAIMEKHGVMCLKCYSGEGVLTHFVEILIEGELQVRRKL